MNQESASSGRGRFEGVTNIVRFNPGYFAVSSIVLVFVTVFLFVSSGRIPLSLVLLLWGGTGLAVWWLVASLIVSWWIYDRSSLYSWSWLPSGLIEKAEVVAAAHAGFDEVSRSLSKHLTQEQLLVLDFYDPERMTEKSIQRARRYCPPTAGTLPVERSGWKLPVRPDVVLFMLSAHEWRIHSERVDILASARESLSEQGCIIIVEHLRDFANFLAFGPGFIHFHSELTWQKAWTEAGLVKEDQFNITPFLGVFVLKPLTHYE